ncbi:low temperature requirement protein A [Microtetraspora glauca]|uniref:Low temperature requirement protein A n=1 Tax=Microtetraspora glauca TaxID=1996 RepID=A0ABV3GKE5_MICGL
MTALRKGVHPAGEDHRATPFELFFDLVYVFAITQVTGHMARERSVNGVLQGILTLAMLWGTWSGYTWLGNHSRADQGALRAGMIVAMAAMFVVALAIPEAWSAASGAPLLLVCAYLLVRLVHLTVFAKAASDDTGLRHQIAVSWLPMLAGAALLVPGALLGGRTQLLLFAIALLVDWAGIYLTARRGAWRLHSPAHLAERHGLFMILAIGESLIAIGAGAAGQAVSGPLLVAAVLGMATAVCLWWLYFGVAAREAERRLSHAHGRRRVTLAVEAYTYGHFPIIAGILLTALGIEGVVAHLGDGGPLGVFSALALHGGAALYLLGQALFGLRMHGAVNRLRLLAAGAVLAVTPLAVVLPPLAGLSAVVIVLVALIAAESRQEWARTQQFWGSFSPTAE